MPSYTRQHVSYLAHRIRTQVRRVYFEVSAAGDMPEVRTTPAHALVWLAEMQAAGLTEVIAYEFHEPRVGWCVSISTRRLSERPSKEPSDVPV